MKNIRSLREKIDLIDNQIQNLLVKRFKLIDRLAHLKVKQGVPIYIKQREKTKLMQIKGSKYLFSIFKSILDASKKYQTAAKRRFTKNGKNDKIIL
ncbi:chorismate mutase [Candidatus Peregrinibacteria bacterium]|nr:chorismate mutase [Candidatus Peregrinibacteria bacterium]